ncbi:MAG: DUF6468 domain-containing protein [Pseudomonadota bacterium]
MTPGLLIEGLIIVLLIATIAYCALLSSRLKRLKSDESGLRSTIAELLTATELAERAIKSLKGAAMENQKTLGNQVRDAQRLTVDLREKLEEGDRLMEKLVAITSVAQTPPPRRPQVAVSQAARPQIVSSPRAVSDLAAEATARISAIRGKGG